MVMQTLSVSAHHHGIDNATLEIDMNDINDLFHHHTYVAVLAQNSDCYEVSATVFGILLILPADLYLCDLNNGMLLNIVLLLYS